MMLIQYSLLIGCLLLAMGSVAAWYRGRIAWAMGLLMVAAFLLRVLMSRLDPFLHDWDERFHALVAKNMMAHPFTPMLRAEEVLPYSYKDWCCNHIWLHKQPLFLWQMALSMKIFGVSDLAMRLPSALLGSLILYPIYRLGTLIFNQDTGYLAALLAAFAFYQLEQTSGVMGMDHDDVAFAAYVTASIWAYYEYRVSPHPWRWLVLVGLFAGAAVLCKWLVGLVVYAGWGLAILFYTPRRLAEYVRLAISFAVAGAVFMPWQLYIAWRFPVESAYERAYATRHFSEVLEGQQRLWTYHFDMLPIQYGGVLSLILVGMVVGLIVHIRRPIAPVFGMVILVFAFFTVAATKMYSYTYITSNLLLILAAAPLAICLQWVRTRFGRLAAVITAAQLLLIVAADLQPWGIIAYHFQEQPYAMSNDPIRWQIRADNAALYRTIDASVPEGYLVFNVLAGDEMAAMFYSNRTVLPWWPSETELRRLQAQGRKIAVFPDHHDQHIPQYLRSVPGLLTIWGTPR